MGLAPTAATAALALGNALAVGVVGCGGIWGGRFWSRPHVWVAVCLPMCVTLCIPARGFLQVNQNATPGRAVLENIAQRVRYDRYSIPGKFWVSILMGFTHTLEKHVDFTTTLIRAVMSRSPRSIAPDALAAEAVQVMEQYNVRPIQVTDTTISW